MLRTGCKRLVTHCMARTASRHTTGFAELTAEATGEPPAQASSTSAHGTEGPPLAGSDGAPPLASSDGAPPLASSDGAPPLAGSDSSMTNEPAWEVPVPLAAGAPPLAGLVSGVTDEPAPLPWEPRVSVPRGRDAALGAAG